MTDHKISWLVERVTIALQHLLLSNKLSSKNLHTETHINVQQFTFLIIPLLHHDLATPPYLSLALPPILVAKYLFKL